MINISFYAKKFESNEKIEGPEVILVARIKPTIHHYKAGNLNNCLFNEKMEGKKNFIKITNNI